MPKKGLPPPETLSGIFQISSTKKTRFDIDKIAALAGLKIKKNEIKRFEEQLQSVLDYIDKLKEVNIEKVDETSQVTGLENVTREDIPNSERILSQEEALSGTSSKQNGFFKVKGILNEE